jgi:DNA-binding beta-propeller fold protein YncE
MRHASSMRVLVLGWLLASGCSDPDEPGDPPDAAAPDAAAPDAAAPDAMPPGPGTDAAPGTDANLNPAPAVTVEFPPPSSMTDLDTILVRGTASDDDGVAAIRVNGVAATTSDDYATWQAQVPLVHGSNAIMVESEDLLGRVDGHAAEVSVRLSAHGLRHPTTVAWDFVHERALLTGFDVVVGVDMLTGERTLVSSDDRGTGPVSLQAVLAAGWDPVRNRLVLGDWQFRALIAVDPSTGNRTIASGLGVGSGPTLENPAGLAWDPVRNRMLVTEGRPAVLLSVDLATGARAVVSSATVGSGPALSFPAGVAWDPARERALVTDRGLRALVAVDVTTGNRTIVSSADVGAGPALADPGALLVEPTSERALVIDQGTLVSIDLVTGDRSAVTGDGPEVEHVFGLAWDPVRERALLGDGSRSGLVALDVATGSRVMVSDFSLGEGPRVDDPEDLVSDPAAGRALLLEPEGPLHALLAVDLSGGPGAGQRSVLVDLAAGLEILEPDAVTVDTARNRVLLLDSGFDNLYAVDLATGESRVVYARPPEGEPAPDFSGSVALDPARGVALVVDPGLETLFAIDLESGEPSVVSGPTQGTGPGLGSVFSVIWDPLNDRAIVFDRSLPGVLSIDPTTGDRQVISGPGVGTGPAVPDGGILTWNPERNLGLLVSDDDTHMRIDGATGNRALLTQATGARGPSTPEPVAATWELPWNRVLVVDEDVRGIVAIDAITGQRVIVSR